MPSTTRFAKQDEAYRDSVLPPSVKRRMSVEAGTTFGWDRWVGDEGYAIGIDHFGASAPASDDLRGLRADAGRRRRSRPAADRGGEVACGSPAASTTAAIPLRQTIFDALAADDHVPVDLGATELDSGDDYPDFALAVVRAVARRAMPSGGSSSAAPGPASPSPPRRCKGIRAAMAHDTYTAAQCVEHDNCNVLALGARVIGPEIASELTSAFANAVFSGEERHVRRLAKVDAIERDGVDAQL